MRERLGSRATTALWITLALASGGGCGIDDAVRTGVVTRVVDGDTIVVDGVGTVRYIGVDTPELHHPRRPVQRLARAARDHNARLVAGRPVRLVSGREPRDTHGRLLAYVFVGPTFVNLRMVRDGYARTLTIKPNDQHAAEFTTAEKDARRRRLGLWGGAEGGPPWGSLCAPPSPCVEPRHLR